MIKGPFGDGRASREMRSASNILETLGDMANLSSNVRRDIP